MIADYFKLEALYEAYKHLPPKWGFLKTYKLIWKMWQTKSLSMQNLNEMKNNAYIHYYKNSFVIPASVILVSLR